MASTSNLRRASQSIGRVGDQSDITDSGLSVQQTGSLCLPPELKGLVAKCLRKSELKNLRLVSQQWHVMATPLLFDRVYVSPREKDLQVFSNITKHPVLSRSIKAMICDISEFPEYSHEEYFHCLCIEQRAMAFELSKKYPFKGPYPALGRFVNAVIRGSISQPKMFSRFGNYKFIREGFQIWRQLAAEESHYLAYSEHGRFFQKLYSGLSRLPNLQSVNVRDDLWDRCRQHWICAFYLQERNESFRTIKSGSPLVRGWCPWHLAPWKRADAGFERLSLVVRALSKTEKCIKTFLCYTRGDTGLSPRRFSSCDMTRGFPRHVANALWQLEILKLQITPRKDDNMNHANDKVLGYLPQLLEKMLGLKSLHLILVNSERRLQEWRTVLDDDCYSYSQVFSDRGSWPRLEHLYLDGLAIDAMDIIFLLFNQMPNLKDLWLKRIDLLGGTWAGVIEALRMHGTDVPWQYVTLHGPFRDEHSQWWPCTPNKEMESEENAILREYMHYAEEGGRHPSLPANSEDSMSSSFYDNMFLAVSEQRRKELRVRVQEFEDRRPLYRVNSTTASLYENNGQLRPCKELGASS